MSSAGKAQIQLKVDGMCCADEVAQVEDALKKLDGVLEVQASIVAGMVTIVYDPSVRDFAPPTLHRSARSWKAWVALSPYQLKTRRP